MVLAAGVVAACNPAASSRSASGARTSSSQTPSAQLPCASVQATPASPDGVTSGQPLWVVATGLSQPDDVYFDRDGTILVGEYSAGRIARIGGQSGLERLPAGVAQPEGITRIGENLYVADQSHDRVVAINGSGQVSTFLQLSPVSGVLGLDQIAAQGDTLIVPDSPHGTVLFVSQQGQVLKRVTGFARPTGAWPLADGSVLIADENANAVFKLAPDGSRSRLATLAVADDVVAVPDGRIFAVSEENGQLIQVGGGVTVSGLKTAQGLTADAAGNLVVTENTAGRVDVVLLTFKLLPASTTAGLVQGQALCVAAARAPGFQDAITLQAGAGYRVVRQPAGNQPGEVVPDLCTAAQCSVRVTAQSGPLSDGAWFTYRSS